jgi:tetratricopeptide (TPR) repeat protein
VADKAHLTDGKTVEGDVVEDSFGNIMVKTAFGTLSFPKHRVRAIEKDTIASNSLLRGDHLLASGKYDEAEVAYKAVLATDPQAAQERLASLRRTRRELVERKLQSFSGEARKQAIQTMLVNGQIDAEQQSMLKFELARLILAEANTAIDQMNVPAAEKLINEGCPRAKGDPDLELGYAKAIAKIAPKDTRINSLLRDSVTQDPSNREAVEEYLQRIGAQSPWDAIRLLLPLGVPRRDATPMMLKMLPQVLLACYNSHPYPPDAPFDRITCYQHYMKYAENASPEPLVRAQIESGGNPYQSLLRWGTWCTSVGDNPTALLSFAAAVRVAITDADRKIAEEKASAQTDVFIQSISTKVGDLLKKRQWDDAHYQVLAAIQVLPGHPQLESLKKDKTAYLDNCFKCNSTGSVICSRCNGTRRVVTRTWKEPCARCGGRGKFANKDDIPVEPGEFMVMVWGTRDSNGKEQWNCPSCSGTGQATRSDTAQCPDCSGKGIVECKTCGATGIVHRSSPRDDFLPANKAISISDWLLPLLGQSATVQPTRPVGIPAGTTAIPLADVGQGTPVTPVMPTLYQAFPTSPNFPVGAIPTPPTLFPPAFSVPPIPPN